MCALLHQFCSGLSRRIDFEGLVAAGVAPGIQVGEFRGNLRDAVIDHVRTGGRLFVDSGAFPAFASGTPVDFDTVFCRYEEIALAASNPQDLFLVAPDKIGDPAATEALLSRHAWRLHLLSELGVNILVPVQGQADMISVWRKVRHILDGIRIIPAMPMRAAAASIDHVVNFLRESGETYVHLLGTSRLAWIRDIDLSCVGITITSDANRLRAAVGLGRVVTENCRVVVEDSCCDSWRRGGDGEEDGTEFTYNTFNTPGFLSAAETATLVAAAGGLGISAHDLTHALLNGGFIDLVGDEYSCELCRWVIPSLHRARVARMVGPVARKAELTRHFSSTRTETELYLPLFAGTAPLQVLDLSPQPS